MTRLGFAGVGWLGESLLKELPRFPALELVAVQDTNLDLAAQVAERYASPWYGAGYAELLALPTVDAVVICTPNALHASQAQAALRAGKDVLVQKPLATTCADAQATVDLASRLGRVLFVDYSYRFLDTLQALAATLATLGPARRARAVFHNIYGPGKAWFFDPDLSGGGALVDLGVHLLDLGLWLLQPERLSLDGAELSWEQGHAVEDAARLRLRLDQVPFELDVSWNAPRPLTEIVFEVQAERSIARWENVDGSFFRFRALREAEVLLDRETSLREDTLRAFSAALVDRSQPTIDLRVYALLDAAYRSRPPSATPRTAPAR